MTTAVAIEILRLIAWDSLFVCILVALLLPLAKFKQAAFAVLKRNFVGYFSNPTGYVFLCLFVLLTSLAAFWPHEFFASNLANLDQLNKLLPYIMLIFIPAITMSIWSEERRLGTDELLLTLPADDFDIVTGKYLAAASIFTASLLFSQLANYIVLVVLTQGDLDVGLFFSTYLGYWLIGLAMLAVGMVASFLTSNTTVAFILGVGFNAPLAFGSSADVIIPSASLARQVSFWGLATHFDDLGRGVISLSSLVYFLLLGTLGLYICMVLIGSRHWSGGRNGSAMFGHYAVRILALIGCLVSASIFFSNYDRIRIDTTLGKVSSLSPKTKEIIHQLDADYPIIIDAFISARVPENYVQTKFNLISRLKEFDAMSGDKIEVRMRDNLEPFSDEAVVAEKLGIQPTMVRTRDRGALKDEEVILGAAVSCGLEKVVIPFFDYGVPVEYELVRSIGTVAQGIRKKVGILQTDALVWGGFSFVGGTPQQVAKQEIVTELEKQYDVEEVDPASPIEPESYDVLIVVQPSSLGPPELTNLVNAVKAGIPTAIFEDPMPIFLRTVSGTGEPKQTPSSVYGQGTGPVPKGEIQELWRTIGIEPPGEPNFRSGGYNPDIVWQNYNPYPKLQMMRGFSDAWVFASGAAPDAADPLNPEEPITEGLKEIFFPVPGAIRPLPQVDLKFTALVKTSPKAGTIRYEQYLNIAPEQDSASLKAAQGLPAGEQILAARIIGVPEDASTTDGANYGGTVDVADDESAGSQETRSINVVYVADIDLMISAFLRIRARPEHDDEIDWHFENVNFLLNIVDHLSGEDQYVEIRRRQPHHSTLTLVEQQAQKKRDSEFIRHLEFQDRYITETTKVREENDTAIKKYQDRLDAAKSLAEQQSAKQDLVIQQQRLNQKLEVTTEQFKRELDERVKKIQRETDLEIRRIQRSIKFVAVALPPIPPLLVGLIVFVRRRLREREGISKERLRLE